MGDDDEACFALVELALQPADRFIIEVVRRLVEEQQIRRTDQRRCQRHALAHAAGEGGDFLRHVVDAESVQDAFGVRLQLPGVLAVHGILGVEQLLCRCSVFRIAADGSEGFFVTAHHRQKWRRSLENLRQHCEVFVHWLILRQIFHDELIGGQHLAFRPEIHAGKLRQKRRFADAVGADETDLVALVDSEPQIIKQYALAETRVQMARFQKNHGNSP